MSLTRVPHDDAELVGISVAIHNAAREVDDPTSPVIIPELASRELRFGWDLEPDERFLYTPDGASDAVAVLDVCMPMRDNLHLIWAGLTVHPDHRGRGHGSALMAEVFRLAEQARRTTVWVGAPEDDVRVRRFAERYGFAYASHDARRRQVLAEVDAALLDALHTSASEAAADYVVERMTVPVADHVLAELVEVTAAINDAPMGELTYEDEHFDVQRLRDNQVARQGVGDRIYRVVARHRESGRLGGHTMVILNPMDPVFAHQGDTAVSRDHRGNRLGMLLKIEMLRWLAETEPQIEVIETWNQADNRHMIDVNEALGYRLSRVYNTYELNLSTRALSASTLRETVDA